MLLEVQESPVHDEKKSAGRYFVRFTRAQRVLHAVLFSTFLGLAATGLPLRFSESIWARRLASEVGGFGAILFFHKLCAIVLTIAFLLHVKEIFTRGLLNREKGIFWGATSMVANWKDVKDMFAHFRWFLGLGPKPTFERYAYWEKFDYWAVLWGTALMGAAGLVLWFPVVASRILPGWMFNVALFVHGAEASLAIGFIFVVHFFNGHLRPGKFPMDLVIFTGTVTAHELRHERPAEFERLGRTGAIDALFVQGPHRVTRLRAYAIGTVGLTLGIGLVALIVFAVMR
jgi:cytochrome b subunit of formate dehydrogenase